VDAAREAGAIVVSEPRRGYGRACLAGLAEVDAGSAPDVVVFMDADMSDRPEELPDVLAPIVCGEADLVIGSRVLGAGAGRAEAGALLPQARFGNWLASRLMRVLFGLRCTDLGPFRVVRGESLRSLGMSDLDFGWTVEMQLRAHLRGLRVEEVPVRYRSRVGQSKITGTVSGTVRAGYKILKTIFAYRLRPPQLPA
jgi:glycosyltransferase involved in cell wall biosynthesis